MKKVITAFAVVLAAAFLLPESLSAAAPCETESLQALSPPGTTIALAGALASGVRAGGWCIVRARIKVGDSTEIQIEMRMPVPATQWNGKLLVNGNGETGNARASIAGPAFSTNPFARPLEYATVGKTTKTAQDGGPPSPDREYLAIHEMTVAAKAIVTAHYGNAAKSTYFSGCGDGGRQALAAAQRYPADFDGIVSGDSENDPIRLQAGQIWTWQQANANERRVLPQDKLVLLRNAVIEKCDTLDGVKDGVIENPKLCRFNPRVLECTGTDSPSCLTEPQVETVTRIYAGLKDAKTGQQIFPGLEPGSEAGWGKLLATAFNIDVYQKIIPQPYYLGSFDASRDVPLALKSPEALSLTADDPNLAPFFDRGGKLLLYHGWADPVVAPMSSVNYYERVREKVGPAKAENSIRLFMVPGMEHCSGGYGTDSFGALAALDEWVEKTQAPNTIPASRRLNGNNDRSRPLCAYPMTAVYSGNGSTDDAKNFTCKAP